MRTERFTLEGDNAVTYLASTYPDGSQALSEVRVKVGEGEYLLDNQTYTPTAPANVTLIVKNRAAAARKAWANPRKKMIVFLD